MWKLFLKLIDKLLGRDKKTGEVSVCPGCPEEIFVKTGWTPVKVYLSFSDGIPPTCSGGVDSFDSRIVPGGFVIIAKIVSQARTIQWVACKH